MIKLLKIKYIYILCLNCKIKNEKIIQNIYVFVYYFRNIYVVLRISIFVFNT